MNDRDAMINRGTERLTIESADKPVNEPLQLNEQSNQCGFGSLTNFDANVFLSESDWTPPSNEAGIWPAGHCVLVRMDEVERTTASGIVIRDEQADREEMSGTKATVIAVGVCAWADQKEPWAKVGDNVMIAKHAGQLWAKGKVKYRVISDLSVCGVIHDDDAI